jgi:predicted Zn-dependent protease
MKASIIKLVVFAILVSMCKTVPLTGRKGLKLISSQEINAMSFQQYDQLKQSEPLSNNTRQVQQVQQVGERIQKAIEAYLQANGHSELLDGFQWEFVLIESEQVNAFCMPGGKVAFYTGILPYCQDETGIAVVMGHEIAHAIAEHGNERMSQALLQQMGGITLGVAMKEQPAETQALFAAAYGLGSQYGVMLPFSRKHESEADELGLYFMAMAGYDPEAAPDFWLRMSKAGGQKPPEFMSTHPADQTRANHLRKIMPKAKEYYEKSKNGNS